MPDSDDEIQDRDLLYRRFFPRGKKGIVPLTAFTKPRTREPDPEISVDLARKTTPEQCLHGQPTGLRIGVLKVGDVRALGFQVVPAPLYEDPAHCHILGVTTDDQCDQLAEITKPL